MPALPTDILDRMRRIEDAIQMLGGRVNMRPALDEVLDGTVLIGEGGRLRVEAPGGQRVLGTGEFETGRYGLVLARSDGTGTALVIGGEDPEYGQMIRIYPRGAPGAVTSIVMDDALHDGWLGRPWLPYPMPEPVSTTTWPATTATSWTTVAVSYATRQHMALSAFGQLITDAGTSGQMRLLAHGAQIGPVASAPAGGSGTLVVRDNLPAGVWGETVGFELQLQRTSGAGSVRGHLLQFEAVNSLD